MFLDQSPHNVDMATLNRHHQRRHAIVLRQCVDVGAFFDQEVDNILVLDLDVDGAMEWCHIILIGEVWICLEGEDVVN